jgi:hypothetical protein
MPAKPIDFARRNVRLSACARADIVLSGETGQSLTIYDHYVARLADIVDILALASRVSHA